MSLLSTTAMPFGIVLAEFDNVVRSRGSVWLSAFVARWTARTLQLPGIPFIGAPRYA